MEREIHSIIEAVRSREERRRRTALSINAALIIAVIAPLCVLVIFYPIWVALVWTPPLVVAAIFVSRSEYQSISVTYEEASLILDATLKTKERVRTFAIISRSSAAPDLVRSAFIAEQIRAHIPPAFTPANILDLKLTRDQRWAIVASLLGVLVALALFILRPLSPLERVAHSLQKIVDAHPELPKEVAVAVQQSIEKLSSSDLAAAQESLQKTQEEITKALASQHKTAAGERTIESEAAIPPQSIKEQSQNQPKPTPSPAPQQPGSKGEAKAEREKEKDASLNKDTGDQQEQNKEKQASEDSQEKSEQGASEKDTKSENQEQEGKSAQEKESKDDGKSQEGQSNKSQDGEGQGSGQGAGSSGSGSGNQGENKDQSSQSQGQSGAAQQGQGQGEGSAQDSQGGPQSKGGSSKEGEQKEGSPSGASGLEQLQKAVSEASKEVQKEEKQQQGGDQEGKQGEEGKGEGDKESSSGKEKESKGSQGNKEDPKQQQGQRGKGDSKSSASNKQESSQDQKGKGEKGSQSKSDSQKNDPKQKEQGNAGKSGKASQQSQPEKEKEDQESGESEADGAGDKSSMPDRSAKAKDEAPPSEGEGRDLSALPPPVKESQIENNQEQLDARFTGGDSTLEENKKPAQAKTTLDDVILAKPQGSTHKGSQPIPLEYRDILAEHAGGAGYDRP